MPKYIALITVGILSSACTILGKSDNSGDGNGSGGAMLTFGSGGSGASSGSGDPVLNAGTGGLEACTGVTIEPESVPAILQIVLDNSLSMNSMTPSTGGQSKWAVTRAALEETIKSLPRGFQVGLVYFPNVQLSQGTTARDVSACVNTQSVVPIADLGGANSPARQALIDSLESVQPIGATPTHDAYNYGLNESLLKASDKVARYMLLMTDGGPTLELGCIGTGLLSDPRPTQPIINSIAAALTDHNIKSFLVGVPGTEDIGNQTHDDGRPWMSTAAVMGGTAVPGCNVSGPNYCHIDISQATDFSAALKAGLGYITRQIVACTYDIPATGDNGDPIDPSLINVLYTPGGGTQTVIKKDDNTACQDGWQLVGNQVVLCPSTCNTVKNDALGQFQLLFGCKTEVAFR